MHGELAQVIALAAHGSAWLTGITSGRAPRLDTANTTFRYVRSVRFAFRGSVLARPAAVSNDVAVWLENARERGVERLWLSIPEPEVVTVDGLSLPERMLAAFAGGGRWFLAGTSKGKPSELWRASWSVGDPEAADQRIWDVEYHGKRRRAIAPPRPDISASSKRLLAALERAETFARDQKLEHWAEGFADARRLAEADDPEPPYHPDLLPAGGYGQPAKRLVATATSAWVFGGMGSWNDLGFETPTEKNEYERVSAELYSAVLGALVAAVNAELD